jgi:xylulokinase
MSAVAEAGYIHESCIRSGTFLVNWMVERLFNVDPGRSPRMFAALEKEAAASPAGANGLALVPYWSGCMTPYWDPRARGVIAGLSSSHTRGDVYRAVMEGIALEQAMVTGRIAAATSPITHFVAIGGGANSNLWCQILADAADREVRRLATIEASSLGAGMAAARGAGWFGTMAEAAAAMAGRPVKVFRPRRKQAAFYREFGAIHAALWPAVAEWNRSLAAYLSRSQR